MRLQDRSRLIARALTITEQLHPASLVFADFDPIPATKRATAQTQALRFGGMTGSAPAIFFIRKTLLPEGLSFVPKETTFSDGATAYLLDALDDEPAEPHVRLTANLAAR